MYEPLAAAFGTQIIEVEPGYEAKDPITGETAIVDDEHAVSVGRTIFVTMKNYEAIKARASLRSPGQGGG
ncbi:hypothetical protein [Microvirga arsenatis]|uniref:Uncharacterized protein n=1 Tax=Microvirga arsenatis TaxID=2692265 RepID=A0ABW9YWT1_9HYPH|nr:hypothetical protein [Microvirga arsenatis]NBJ13362.1 hypothetical protein [Microvirga arsenatis]NBJ24146.1 hypothetical protein [Microvirga arsenatis]